MRRSRSRRQKASWRSRSADRRASQAEPLGPMRVACTPSWGERAYRYSSGVRLFPPPLGHCYCTCSYGATALFRAHCSSSCPLRIHALGAASHKMKGEVFNRQPIKENGQHLCDTSFSNSRTMRAVVKRGTSWHLNRGSSCERWRRTVAGSLRLMLLRDVSVHRSSRYHNFD